MPNVLCPRDLVFRPAFLYHHQFLTDVNISCLLAFEIGGWGVILSLFKWLVSLSLALFHCLDATDREWI